MTFNPHAATVDEMRQWILLREWRPPFTFDDSGVSSTAWERRDGKPSGLSWHEEPTIPATLDWVAKAMPEGIRVSVAQLFDDDGDPWAIAHACRKSGSHIATADAAGERSLFEAEVVARTRLLCLVLMAEDVSKGKEPT